MRREEFDKFADEYAELHARNIRASGEGPSFFAEYKVRDLSRLASRTGALAPGDPGVVLDFGGGVGNATGFLRREFPSALVVNIDVSRRSLAVARAREPGACHVSFDGDTIPFASGSVDIALCACVFHHIPHVEHVQKIAEIRRTLKAGGLLVIYEHNPLNPLTVRAVNTCPFDADARLIRATEMRTRFLQAGFPSATLEYRLFFPGFARSLRFMERHLPWLPLGAQYLVYATK